MSTSEPIQSDKDENAIKCDKKFIDTHKKQIVDIVLKLAAKYLKHVRPLNTKKITMDAQAKTQLMSIITVFIETASNLSVSSNNQDISELFNTKLDINSYQYMIHSYLSGVAYHMEYELGMDDNEEDILNIIVTKINDEEVAQYAAKLLVLFTRKLAEKIANYNWNSTRNLSSVNFSTIIRNMDDKGTNPSVFLAVYDFANSSKNHKS